MSEQAQPPAPAPRVWTTLDLIGWTKSYFEKHGLESPRVEAELLLAEALGCARIRLYADFEKPVAAEVLAKFREWVKRRGEKREPLQYIVGNTQFIDLKLKVTPAALIPRPETEVLAAWAVERAKAAGEAPRVLDLCTGSGCVALFVASKIAGAKVVATDLSEEALALARENAGTLGLAERVEFLHGDLFAALKDPEPFDLITANPPYIDPKGKASLQAEVRDYEPALALFSDGGGTALGERIIKECGAWLKPGAMLGMEYGIGQGEQLKGGAEKTQLFTEVKLERDHEKVLRFIVAKRK